MVAVPLKLRFGTNRTRCCSSLLSKRADAELTPDNELQFPPPSVVYCQEPLLESTDVIAMPLRALESTSEPAFAKTETAVPALSATATSSAIAVNDAAPATGASFTGAKVIVTVAGPDQADPSEAVTVKVFAPFSLAAGV